MRRVCLLALAVAMFATTTAKANLFYTFRAVGNYSEVGINDGDTISSPISIDVADVPLSFTFEIYLTEDGKGADPTPITSNGDLRSGGVQISDAGDSIFTLDSISANTAQFDSGGANAANGKISVTQLASNPSTVAVDSDGGVLLGTVTFTIDGSIGDTVDVSLDDPSGSDDIVAGTSPSTTVLDGILSAPTTITINVVPEPSSIMLCGLAVCGMAGAGFRRWRRRKAEPLAS